MKVAAAMLLFGLFADEPWPYPLGPFTESADAQQAARLERSFEAAGGMRRAVRQLCASDSTSLDVPGAVAGNFLIAHADRAVPNLLDRLARAAARGASCESQLEWNVLVGVCFGYDAGGTGPAMDAHPLAVERRQRAQRALVKALEAGGRRGEAAMRILDRAGTEICTGGPDTIRAATPDLVKRLGAPKSPLVTPRGDDGDPAWAHALRALTFEGVDRSIAEAPVRAFLAHDETVALAAHALARMGADATPALPRLQRLLDAVVPPQGTWPSGELVRVGDLLRALQAIGRPAAVALPNIAAVARRIELPACRTFGREFFVGLVRAVATPATAKTAVEILRPMLSCPGYNIRVTEALAALGPAARDAVLSGLRDESRTVAERLASARALARPGQPSLDASDQRLARLLEEKLRTHTQHVGLNLSPPESRTTAVEVTACRAEAGLEALPAPPPQVSWDFASCISNYLCGPARETYAKTIERCCGPAGNEPGGACQRLLDPAFRF